MVFAGCRGRLQSNGGRAMASRRIGIPSRKSISPMAKAPKARVKSASSKFASFCINKNAPVKKRNARRITEKILRQKDHGKNRSELKILLGKKKGQSILPMKR